ncbi:MAG: protein kinase [Deltaproteobacteria bacterium]|nr:protein kinase [Deltaproteobacteria bacterium]
MPPPAHAPPPPAGAPESTPGLGCGSVVGEAGEHSEAASPTLSPSERYTRVGLIGRGGMGAVWLAHDRVLDRDVALKEAGPGEDLAGRLAREAQITAALDHPGVVTVHDRGLGPDGRPFYTMRLLRGRPLRAALDERADPLGRLGLLRHYLDACHALAHAHAHGVVHRDVKPDNIVVGAFGETQVVDWGLACRAGAGGGAPAGTPGWMAPEQAAGAPAAPTADVWALGAVLRAILHEPTPSPDRRALRSGPPELRAIADRALAAHPADRYPDAGALAADVAAFIDGRRVEAHRYTPRELLVRLVRAWRAPLLVAGVAVLLLAGLGVWAAARLAAERDLVVAANQETEAALGRALEVQARAALADGDLAVAAALAGRAVAAGPAPEAWGVLMAAAVEPGPTRSGQVELPGCAQPRLLGEDDVLCIHLDGVERRVAGATAWRWAGAPGQVRVDHDLIFLSPAGGGPVPPVALRRGDGAQLDGDWRGFGSWTRRIWPVQPPVWGVPLDVYTGHQLAELLCLGAAVEGATLDRAAGRWAAACGDGRLRLGAVGSGPSLELPNPATYEAFHGVGPAELSGSGGLLVLSGVRGALAAVRIPGGEVAHAALRSGGTPALLAISPDERWLAVAADRGPVELFTLPDLRSVGRVPAYHSRDLRWSSSGELWVAEPDRRSAWRPPGAGPAHTFNFTEGLTSASFSPDQRRLATTHGRGDALVLGLADAAVLARQPVGTQVAKAAAWAGPEVVWFARTGADSSDPTPEPLGVDGAPAGPSLEGSALVALAEAAGQPADRGLQLRRIGALAEGALLIGTYVATPAVALRPGAPLPAPLTGCPAATWIDVGQAPRGEVGVIVGEGGVVGVVRSAAQLSCAPLPPQPGVIAADVDARGERVAAGAEEAVWLLDKGVERWRVTVPARLMDLSLSPDGRWVVVGLTDHTARVFSAEDGALRAILSGHSGRISGVDIGADSRLLVTASWDATARLWDLAALDRSSPEAPAAGALSLDEALDAAER